MRICFDMDGTIANLYGVEGWLADLDNYNVRPYMEAKPLVNMSALAKRLNSLRKAGHEVCVISWLSKHSTKDYDERVAQAKRDWLAKHLASVTFDAINIVAYGTAKEQFAQSANDILFDDEEKNRIAWTGKAYDVKNILDVLKNI